MTAGGRAPRTRYAQCGPGGSVDIAYQVFGDGPRDIVMFTGSSIPIDCVDLEPGMARFQRRLAGLGRIVRFDFRGAGLSSHLPGDELTIDDWVEDTLAVLDAVGSEKAVLFAPAFSAMTALRFAAEHPDRADGLIVVNGSARALWAEDYQFGLRPEVVQEFVEVNVLDDALEQGFDGLALVAPSVAGNDAFRSWWDNSGNRAATPSMARRNSVAIARGDAREALARISAPVLLVHRTDCQFVPVEHGRYLAEHLPGARFVELPGADLLYWVGDSAAIFDEVEEFLTGVRGGTSAERILTTVLFSDIVGSTDWAAALGDARWRDLLDSHDRVVRAELRRFHGREVNTAGDGFVATFPSPSRAIDCAEAIVARVRDLAIEVRAGVHAGEVEMRGDAVAGMAVHIGARVAGLAQPSEVLVSSTVRDIVTGSRREFADRGVHLLKGVPGEWRLYAVEPGSSGF